MHSRAKLGIGLSIILLLGACDRTQRDPGLDGVIELDQQGLGFEIGGRVAALSVRRGDHVRSGQVLARLDDTLERSQRPIRLAELAAAEARLKLLEAGPRSSEVRTLDAQVEAANTQVDAAQRELSRQQGLFGRGASTKALLDDWSTRLSSARAEREATEERLRTLRAGSRSQDIRAAAAARDASRAALDALDQRLGHYLLRAPEDGVVLDVITKEGEVLGPGTPVVIFARPQTPYVDVFVPVPALASVRVGQAASVRPDGDRRDFPGLVEQISPTTEYTPRYLLSEADRANLVTRVRIRVDDHGEQLHAGVPCRVYLSTSSAGAPR